MFGWIRKMFGGERRTTAGEVSLGGDPEDLGRLQDELGAMTAGEFIEAMDQDCKKAMGMNAWEFMGGESPLPMTPSVPAGLLPPGNEEFRQARIAEAMEKDSAARYMRGAASR